MTVALSASQTKRARDHRSFLETRNVTKIESKLQIQFGELFGSPSWNSPWANCTCGNREITPFLPLPGGGGGTAGEQVAKCLPLESSSCGRSGKGLPGLVARGVPLAWLGLGSSKKHKSQVNLIKLSRTRVWPNATILRNNWEQFKYLQSAC